MEDRILTERPFGDEDWSVFGVFDGHGSSYTSNYVSKYYSTFLLEEVKKIEKDLNNGNSIGSNTGLLQSALKNACFEIDRTLSEQSITRLDKKSSAVDKSGSTMISALFTNNLLAISNVGDSRAVLAQWENGHLLANQLSNDHKLNLPLERQRAIEAGAT